MAYLKNLKEMLKLNIRNAIKDKENKEEIIDEIINDLHSQTKRLEFMVEKAEKDQQHAETSYSINKEEADNLVHKARSALRENDNQLAKEALTQKLEKDMSLKEKEIIYVTLNAQASQLKEQLETLNYKLSEAIEIKKTLSSNIHINNYVHPTNQEIFNHDKSEIASRCHSNSEGVLDAEIERLMQEIKDTHNIK